MKLLKEMNRKIKLLNEKKPTNINKQEFNF